MYKDKTPILISMPRNGSHYVATYLRRTYHLRGLLYPLSDYGAMELFNTSTNKRSINSSIEMFETLRNNFDLDIFNIFHGPHLMEKINIPSRPHYRMVFDWFKEFYNGYQIVLLRRKNIWKSYISWLFHCTIRDKLQHEENNEVHPWHSKQMDQNDDILKSTIETIKPDFVHNEALWQNYIRDVKYFNEEVIDYYLNDYSRTLVRDWWLEDLNDEMLEENYKYNENNGSEELLVRNKNFKPSSIKYQNYFSTSELHTIKSKFDEVYKTTFKPYGYLVD
tara:strand:- start:525 stop:1358 length:834 start_codon:yes stop_codon:yes gene_type:complete